MKEIPISKSEALQNRFNKRIADSDINDLLPRNVVFDDILDQSIKAIRDASETLRVITVKYDLPDDKECREKCFTLLKEYFRLQEIDATRLFYDQHDNPDNPDEITSVIDNSMQFLW